MESIKHAAVIAENGWVVFGKSHAECIQKTTQIGLRSKTAADAQGFVTSNGRFVTRPEAAKIAVAAGQVEGIAILFSEDLWSKVSGGKYQHCEINGYC